MQFYHDSDNLKIICGNCQDVMVDFAPDSFDSIVTDPPYGLSFMGKKWDHGVPGKEYWKEVLRVAKPGAHLLAFGGTRTFHRLAVAIEDAGWEIRDTVMWVYGSGFPKSLDVGKAIDTLCGNERIVVDRRDVGHDITSNGYKDAKPERKIMDITKGNSDWEGWGTALKPAWEPIIVARKPVIGTVAQNVQKYGTGVINIDECRVAFEDTRNPATNPLYRKLAGYKNGNAPDINSSSFSVKKTSEGERPAHALGRFPANLIHDGSDEVVSIFPQSKGQQGDVKGTEASCTGGEGTNCFGKYNRIGARPKREDEGSAARFFYCAKASKEDRGKDNKHPTVKPTALMRYLCRLVTPPGGLILDPFAGSFSTGKAAQLEGFRFVGITLDEEDCRVGLSRMAQGALL